jgi:hypothetical protein
LHSSLLISILVFAVIIDIIGMFFTAF